LDKGVYASAAAVSLPGRFQRISYRGQQLVLDVAHNPAAATNLADHLRELRPSGQIHLLLALMRDKDCQGFVAALSPLVDHWYVTGLPDVPRALAGAELARHITVVSEQQASVYASPEEGIEEALARMAGGDILLVAGSFFLVGAVMTIINSGESA
jgi:dihydrofolate synthase/folylpolyglutamate synthase